MRQELHTLVMYDIESDRIRYRVSEACLDFGLERIQFSVFRGKLNRNKREELLMRLTQTLGDEPGKILIQPMCEDDFKSALELVRGSALPSVKS
jgi:CRISPR-associated protein Cas2